MHLAEPTPKHLLKLCAVLLATVVWTLTGCVSATMLPGIVITVSPTTASVQAGTGTQSFTAAVANDPHNKGVTWSLSGASCTGSTCGTLSNVTATSVTYAAPANAPSPDSVTLTATSVADPTKSAIATVTVTAAAAAPTVTLSASPMNIASGDNSTLTWSSTNATSCSASGGWTGTMATSGTDSVSPTGTTTYTLTCTGPGGTSSPASATVTLTNGSGGPGAPANLQLINQGGPQNGSSPLTNYQQISWTAATPGALPIAYYQIYRNGVGYDTTAGTSYTDRNAPQSNDPTWATPATVYSYQVAAVDTQGNLGPQAAQMSVYSYQNGESNWGNSDLSWGTIDESYASTSGNPQGGSFDISVDFIAGGFQPTANTPQSPQWDLEIGAFNYFTIDVNPGPTTAYVLNLGTVSRVPPGDVYGWHPAVNVFSYGPAPVANTWATYRIPLTDLGMGICQFTGSISGTTLTVTAITSGPALVDNAGFVTGPGVPAGTYIIASAQNSAIGTFTVTGPGISSSTSVPAATMTYQRTSL